MNKRTAHVVSAGALMFLILFIPGRAYAPPCTPNKTCIFSTNGVTTFSIDPSLASNTYTVPVAEAASMQCCRLLANWTAVVLTTTCGGAQPKLCVGGTPTVNYTINYTASGTTSTTQWETFYFPTSLSTTDVMNYQDLPYNTILSDQIIFRINF